MGAYGFTVMVTQLDSTLWPSSLFSQQFAPPIRRDGCRVGVLVGAATFAVGSFMIVHRARLVDSASTSRSRSRGGSGCRSHGLRPATAVSARPVSGALPPWLRSTPGLKMCNTPEWRSLATSRTIRTLWTGPDASNYVQVLGETQPEEDSRRLSAVPSFAVRSTPVTTET